MCDAQVSVSVILNKSECAVCIIYIHFNSSLECLRYSTATLLEFVETICRALAVSQAVCETLSRLSAVTAELGDRDCPHCAQGTRGPDWL